MKKRLKAKKKALYRLLVSACVSEIRAFKVSGILKKDAKRKSSILCPFNKHCDANTVLLLIEYLQEQITRRVNLL